MKLCRYDDDRLGLVRDGAIHDVSAVRDELPVQRWPLPLGDLLIRHLPGLRARMEKLADGARPVPVDRVRLKSPVANPSKIVGAPVNYLDHLEESKRDQGIAHGRDIKTIAEWGLFLKANTSLVGPSEGVAQRFPARRNDHEVELAVVIGRTADRVPAAAALDHVAGYAIGLDMTVRGTEFPGFRKSIDTYAVLGPWLVTADEIPDPGQLDLRIWVNGEKRQDSNTRFLHFGVPRLIEFASSFYTLLPGDIIMTGTPAGVGPVTPGDRMTAEIERLGRMEVTVRLA